MAAPREFTLDAVRCFIIEKGGKVTNHELVKHFKQFLTDPATKESARIQFKEYVNTLATIKQEDQEKYLVLKRRFYAANYADFVGDSMTSLASSPTPLYSPTSPSPGMTFPLPEFRAPPPYRPPPDPYRFNRSSSLDPPSPMRPDPPLPVYPPPFRQRDDTPPPLPPPPVQRPPPVLFRQASFPPQDASLESSASFLPPRSLSSSTSSFERPISANDLILTAPQVDDSAPPPAIPPRRKPGPITGRSEDKENTFNSVCSSSSSSADLLSDNNEQEVKISVKERTQRFNKMASEVDLQRGNNSNGNLNRRDHKAKAGGEDDDTSSVGTMEPHGGKEWMLAIARGDYHSISRLLREEPRLARRRDFVTGYTGLHWAAKHGNDALVKMLAGTYKSDVNARTNAGCTPLHIAAQQGHEEVFDLLVKTYGADSNLRDYSGKKPYQYFPRQDTCISSDAFRSEYKAFERGGLYSSLRHSFFKFNPSPTSECNYETKQSSPFSEPSPGEHERKSLSDKRRLSKTTSFLRELRPSVRKRMVEGNI